MGLQDVRLVQLPKIPDERGNLSFFENESQVPFAIARTYWIFDVPAGQKREGYACKTQQEFIIALSGSFNVVITDGIDKKTYTLNRPDTGLVIPPLLWRHLDNFATNSLALIAADGRNVEGEFIYHQPVHAPSVNG